MFFRRLGSAGRRRFTSATSNKSFSFRGGLTTILGGTLVGAALTVGWADADCTTVIDIDTKAGTVRVTQSKLDQTMSSLGQQQKHVLVVGSVNIDLFKDISDDCRCKFGDLDVDISGVKGATLPAKSFVHQSSIITQIKSAGRLPTEGTEEEFALTMQGPFVQKTGGKGANTAAAAAQTATCEFIGQFGGLTLNQLLHDDLRQTGGVDFSHALTVPDIATGTAYILKYPCGDNAIILLGGANQAWQAAAVSGTTERVDPKSTAVVMLQREVPRHLNLAVAQRAAEAGIPVLMDVGGSDAPLDDELLRYVSVVVPNEIELEWISGVRTRDEDGQISKALVREAVAALMNKSAALQEEAGGERRGDGLAVMVTLGSKGALFFEHGWRHEGEEGPTGLLPFEHYAGRFQLGTPSGRPVDTTGAGDCFRGSFAAAYYAKHKGLGEALEWASAAASLCVESKGAMTSMPNRAEIAARVKTGEMLRTL